VRHIIIDGYNLLHASRETDHDWTHLDLEDAREQIVSFLAGRRRPKREKLTVVFDGGALTELQPRERSVHGVRVLFSEPGVSADEVICRMVTNAPDAAATLVVTADREIRSEVISAGARVVGPRNFILTAEEHHERRKRRKPLPREKFEGLSKGEVERWREIFGFDGEDEE